MKKAETLLALWGKTAHLIVWLICLVLFKIFFRFEVEGRENLKGLTGPLVVTPNHSSWVDPFFVMAAIPPFSEIAPIHFAVGYGYYWAYLPLMVLGGTFPIKKGIGLERTLKKGLKILAAGGTVGIFPEGSRRHFGRPRRAKRGAAFLALKTKSPIVPVFIQGSLGLGLSDIWSRRRIKLKIGRAFLLPDRPINQPSDLNQPADLTRKRIYELREKKEDK
jgi:1-acyl-sn-glycerol-3-phosphate acyltransferase